MNSIFSTKFVQLLKSLDTDEMKALDSWLRSPWCNSNKNLIQLFSRLRKYHPNFMDSKLTKEGLFHSILPNSKFSNRRMNNLLSEAFLAVKKFLIFQHFDNKLSHVQQEAWAQESQSRYLNEWFFKDVNKLMAYFEQLNTKNFEEHLTLYRLNRMTYFHPKQETRLQKGYQLITTMDEQLELLYLLEKAFIINEKIARSRFLKKENHEVDTSLKLWRSASQQIVHPAIQLYRLRFDFLEKGAVEKYYELRSFFIQYMELLTPTEQKTHLISLLNDTKILIRQGLMDITATLELYRLGLKIGAVFNQGKLTLNTFVSIISASNTKGSFEFTNSFIDKYASHLNKSVQVDGIQWAKAHTAYWKKDLEISLDILSRQDFKSLFFKYIGRVLNTQVYFELSLQDNSYQEYIESYLDTFEKWLNREQLWSDAQRSSFINFVKKCRVLHRAYHNPNNITDKIEHLLDGQKNIQALNWLEQKQQQILGRKNR